MAVTAVEHPNLCRLDVVEYQKVVVTGEELAEKAKKEAVEAVK